MVLCGGTSDNRPADEEIQTILENVKEQVMSKTNQTLDDFVAVSYKSQVVAGTNFFIKVKIGEGRFIHLRVFRPLPPNQENLQLHSLQEGKTEAEEIAYF